MNRTIGSFGGQNPGTLVLAFGALHGNEPAGVGALEAVFQMLEREDADNPDFVFHGKLVGIFGNLRAFGSGVRFLEKDLNRQWTLENVRRIQHSQSTGLKAEDLEMAELLTAIHAEIQEAKSETLALLDLHTTSAEDGIFCIPTDDAASLDMAKKLNAPVILGLHESVEGTLLRFAADGHFQIGGYPKHTIGAAFEAGQHDDPLSISRSVSAIVNCLRAAGCIRPEDLGGSHDTILKEYKARLPRVTRLRHVHHICPGDGFRMRPGYVNFQPIEKGERLADDMTGPIYAPDRGLILMPLYQPKGSDGFFIVQSILE